MDNRKQAASSVRQPVIHMHILDNEECTLAKSHTRQQTSIKIIGPAESSIHGTAAVMKETIINTKSAYGIFSGLTHSWY